MLKKLLKYDLRSAGRLIGILYLAVLAVSVLVGILFRVSIFQENADAFSAMGSVGAGIAALTSVAIYVVLIIVMMVMTVIMIIRHFYRNMIKQEGYLMHTLPVPAWMHVASKTIAGFIWMLIAYVVSTVSLLLMLACGGIIKEAFDGYKELFASLGIALSSPTFWLFVICAVIGIVATVLLFYLSLAIGNLSNRHKFFYAVLAFVVIVIIMTIVRSILMMGNNGIWMSTLINPWMMTDETQTDSFLRIMNHTMIVQLLENIGWSVVFFLGTKWILEKKLNLE